METGADDVHSNSNDSEADFDNIDIAGDTGGQEGCDTDWESGSGSDDDCKSEFSASSKKIKKSSQLFQQRKPGPGVGRYKDPIWNYFMKCKSDGNNSGQEKETVVCPKCLIAVSARAYRLKAHYEQCSSGKTPRPLTGEL